MTPRTDQQVIEHTIGAIIMQHALLTAKYEQLLSDYAALKAERDKVSTDGR